jgi:hypothetical protein
MKLLALACFVFAIVDFLSFYLVGYDITGVSWSPVAASIAGSVLLRLGD